MVNQVYTKISQLPAAAHPVDGTELMEMDQGGVSRKIPISGLLINSASFVMTVDQSSVFPQSRSLVAGSGITLTDSGAGGTLTISSSLGGGTVTSVSVVTANGVSGSVSNPTTTPAITLTLGAITPSSVAATGTVTGSNLSGTNTGNQTITLTGNVTGSGTGSFAATIANDAVTYAKIQNVTTNKLLGRATAGSGDIEEITLGTNLSFTGTTLNAAGGGGGGPKIATGRVEADGTLTTGMSQHMVNVDHLTTGVYQLNYEVGYFTTSPVVTLTVEDEGLFGGPTGKLAWCNVSLFSESFCIVTIATQALSGVDSIFHFTAVGT